MALFLWSSLLIAALTASAQQCINMSIPVSISARNGVFGNIPIPQTNLDASAFIQNLTRQGGNYTAEGLTDYATVSGQYSISAQYCMPSSSNSSSSKKVLQVLTHGIGSDKSYWNLAYNNFENSYTNSATASGFYTFSYDRLGVGNSSHGDPRNEIQFALEVAALADLTQKLRDGSIADIKDSFDSVVHVGHSFGSGQTLALSAQYPNLTDGVVLTGFSANGSFIDYYYAAGNFRQANRILTGAAAAYPAGYLANGDLATLQYLLLHSPNFDIGLAAYVESGRQAVSIGELLTVGSIPETSAFTGPVLVFDGANDLPFCGGNCLATGDPDMPNIPMDAQRIFPNAKNFEVYIQPETGHGLTFHLNATAGYQVIQDWITANAA